MGKLLVGHYGGPPEAESIVISLKECHQRLGLKPSDFVSPEEPNFFRKQHRAVGKYLVFYAEPKEVSEAAVWQTGYYLLPLDAADALKVFDKNKIIQGGGGQQRPIEIECKTAVPDDVMKRAQRWNEQSQPLLFQCHCSQLLLKLDAPSLIRRHWKARLTCRKRCQPDLKTHL